MKMSLLHALAALLTVLMLVVRQRHALAAVCSNSIKHRKLHLETQILHNEYCGKAAVPSRLMTHCSQQTSFFERPKYKRDPEIHVDNEQIGHRPCED